MDLITPDILCSSWCSV